MGVLRCGPAVAFIVLTLGYGRAAIAAESLDGVWDTPIGKVRIDQTRDGLVGKLAEVSPRCPSFAKGADVLRGNLVDDIFTGELRSCFHPKCKTRDAWTFAMAAKVGQGDDLAGAVTELKGCANIGYRDNAFVFRRQKALAALPVSPTPAEPLGGPPRPPRARKSNPQVDAYVREGTALMPSGAFEQARAKFLKANALDPHNAEVLNYIGVTYYARNLYKEASLYYQKAIAAETDYADAYYNLACIYAMDSRSDLALKTLWKAVNAGYSDLKTLDSDQDLGSIRGDPEFASLRKSVQQRVHRR